MTLLKGKSINEGHEMGRKGTLACSSIKKVKEVRVEGSKGQWLEMRLGIYNFILSKTESHRECWAEECQGYILFYPPIVHKDSTSLSALAIFCFFYSSHPNGCEIVITL